MHQFSKVELFVISTPEQSDQLHQELLHARDQLILALQPKPAPTVVADDAPPETVAAAPHPSRSSGAKRGGAKKTPS